MRTRICDMFGIEFPIFAFSHCRDVVAAVSRAGGFGVLGAVAFSPEELEVELRWIDEHVQGKPYGVDIVMPASSVAAQLGEIPPEEMEKTLEKMIPEKHRKFVEDVLERYRVPKLPEGETVRGLLGWTNTGAKSHVEVALAHPVRLLVNALGPPPREIVDLAHEHGVPVAALVGTAEQARKQVAQGVDVIVAQGTEAGGHTGEISTFVLVPDVVDAVHPTPVLAAGGIGCGRQVAAALALGADGVWTGSIWLTVTESDTIPVVKEKLLRAGPRDTVRSRSWTGKPARLLRTAWTEAWDSPDSPGPLPMPLQFMLTAEAQHRMHKYAHLEDSGAKELVGTPVGQIVGRMNSIRPARDVIYEMVEEFLDTVERLRQTLGAAAEAEARGSAD
ncbi:MAG: monooxygenase [Candidatus Binatia bacterium]|nr:MAG: monooxygenase [Candidatus Binatia bacterium]